MGLVGIVAASTLRARWRSVAVLTLLVASIAAVTFASVAGARRTASTLTRFSAQSDAADVELLMVGAPTAADMHALDGVRGVEATTALRAPGVQVPALPALQSIGIPQDSAFGTTIDRDRIVAGRAADPSAPNEVTIGEGLATLLRLQPGDTLDTESFSPDQIEAILGGASDAGPYAGPAVQLRVVGIDRRPLDLGNRGAAGGFLVLTPAFGRAYGDQIGDFGTRIRVRTANGDADVERVIARARAIFGTSLLNTQGLAIETEGARNAVDLLALSLWLFAGVAAVVGLATIGIVVSRELAVAGAGQSILSTLGATRMQRVATFAPIAALIASGAFLGAFGATLASSLFPFGLARRAEPDTGLRIDWPVLLGGAVMLAVVVLLVAALTVMRLTRQQSASARPTRRRLSATLSEQSARAGLSPAAANGLRMAIDPGRGRTPVPVRSALIGALLGVLGVTAVAVYTASFDHLTGTPHLYGSTWDFEVLDTTANTPCRGSDYGLARNDELADVAEVCFQNVQIEGRPVPAWGVTQMRGTISPALLDGRAPAGPREVALGSKTLQTLGKKVGDTVTVAGREQRLQYRIVGRTVLPSLGQPQPLGDAAWFTGNGYEPLFDQNVFSRYFVGRDARGVDSTSIRDQIDAIPQLDAVSQSALPVEIDRVRRIDWLPSAIVLLLVALSAITVAHALVTTERRRRPEFALLKALGFSRRDVRSTVAYQSVTIALVALVLGLPAGLLLGRWMWRLSADGFGVPVAPEIPAGLILVVTLATIALAFAVAYLPGRAAARTQPRARIDV